MYNSSTHMYYTANYSSHAAAAKVKQSHYNQLLDDINMVTQ